MKMYLQVAAAIAAAVSAASICAQENPSTDGGEELQTIEVSGRFIDSGAKSAMKQDVAVRDTPFSVSDYSSSFMKAIETTNVADLYSYMTGVSRTGSTGYDLNMRGFSMSAADRNAILVDGLPGLAGRFNSPPTAAVERIELVKGPSSVLYGQAQPGGFVNIVSKKPLPQQSLTIDAKGLSYAGEGHGLGDKTGYDASVDVTGPIDRDGHVLYRMILERGDRDLFRTDTYERTLYVAPSLTWRIAAATAVTFLYEHRDGRDAYDQYLVAPGKDIARVASLDTRYQQPADFRKENSNAYSLSANHTFDNEMKLSLGARSVRNGDDSEGYDTLAVATTGLNRGGTACTPSDPCVRMRARGQENRRKYDFVDTNLSTPFATGPIAHRLLFGVTFGREVTDFERSHFTSGVASCTSALAVGCLTTSLYSPTYNFPALSSIAPGPLTRQYTTSRSAGAYASDLLTISPRWKATVGVRYALERQSIQDLFHPEIATLNKRTQQVTPTAGLLFQPTKEWTLYASYATSYVPAPASAQDINGRNPFKPESARQFEVGAKFDMVSGLATGTLALYDIQKTDALSTFACAIGTCTLQVGRQRSKGAEAEVNLRPAEGAQVAVGYSYTDATIIAATDPSLISAHLVNSPRNSAHFWSRYDFEGLLKGWGVGTGVNYIDVRAGTLPSAADPRVLRLPAYYVADLGIYYTLPHVALTLKFGNLFGRNYIESAGFQGGDLQVLPGSPRNVQFSARTSF